MILNRYGRATNDNIALSGLGCIGDPIPRVSLRCTLGYKYFALSSIGAKCYFSPFKK